MARLYQKRGVWYAWGYTAAGKRWAKTTRQRDRRAANIVARKLERDIVGAADDAAHATATLGEAVTALIAFQRTSGRAESTIANTIVKAGHLLRILGEDMDIAALTPPDGEQALSRYVARRVEEGANRSSVSVEIVVCKAALRTAARAGRWRGDSRALSLPELNGARKPRKSWALPDALAKVVTETPPQWRDYVEIYAGLGVRRMELCGITSADVDLRGNQVHVRGTKTRGADRWVPMSPRVRSILTRRMKGKTAGPLFTEWTRCGDDLNAACKRAGVQRLTVSDLRRTFASTAINQGVSASVLKELLGHSTTRQIDLVYGHASEQAKQDAVGRVARAVARRKPRGDTKGTDGTGNRRRKR